MALDQSALRDLFAELKLTDVPDRIRLATETLCQQLIDAEAAAFIGAAPLAQCQKTRLAGLPANRLMRGGLSVFFI